MESIPPPDPSVETAAAHLLPTGRDICVGDELHRGNLMLQDMIRIHYYLFKYQGDDEDVPTTKEGVETLVARLNDLVLNGKKYELSGLKDVPRPFFKGPGRLFEKQEDSWVVVSDGEAINTYLTDTVLESFKMIKEEEESPDVKQVVEMFLKPSEPVEGDAEEPASHTSPRPCDVLFLPVGYPWEENMPYEHQGGNKHLLFLASQYVSGDITNTSAKRVDAAFRLITCSVDVNNGVDLFQKKPRFVIQSLADNHNSWEEMEKHQLAEFAVMFVYEVYLEKQIHGMADSSSIMVNEDTVASKVPVDAPTTIDVLFGRGGYTNGHSGNRRFRDIIALHRPDYVRATKMDKPNVARRIVKAIRYGEPNGRFLKKGDDGNWYDVGDRCAAEKTSQGLRERSNAEKRQRSALREALRIRREDIEEDGLDPATKKARTDAALAHSLHVIPSYINVNEMTAVAALPLSLNLKSKMKPASKKKGKKGGKDDEEYPSESLPPNAVDKDGNILVTDHDILCGRGGLTNHHQGNKRFRDIVTLHRPDYVRAPKVQKPSVARVIVRAIRNGDPPGRFLRKDEKTGKWGDIGDKKAAEKTSQALREKTGEEKDAPAAGFASPTMLLPKPTDGAEEAKVGDTGVREEKKDEDATDTEDEMKAAAKDSRATSVEV